MKVKDVKIGMQVIDKLGNEYKVVSVRYNTIKLNCTKFVESARVDSSNKFQKVGDVFCITTSEEDAKKLFGCDIDVSIKSIRSINKKILKKFLKMIDKIERNVDNGRLDKTYSEIHKLKQRFIKHFDKAF